MDSDDRRYRDRSPSDRHRSRHHHHGDRPRDKERERDRDGERDRERDSKRDRERSASPGGRRTRREQSAENDPFNPYHEDKAASKKRDAIAAAAAAAERINAQIQAKLGGGGSIPTTSATSAPPSSSSTVNLPNSAPRGTTEAVQEAGDYIRDIEINHLMNRYTLTKGQTQAMIKTETGADVTTRGRYYPDPSQATEKEPPLYLHITSLTKEGLEKAVTIVENLMAKDKEKSTPPAAGELQRREDNPQPADNGAPTGPPQYGDRPPFQRGEYRRRWMEDRVLIGLDYLPGFNVRGQIVGPMGANVKHIQTETGCRVQIKGRGSQFIEQATGRESDEPTFLHILYVYTGCSGQDPNALARAVELSKDLVKTVTDSYNAFKANPRPQQQRYNNRDGGGGGGRGYRDGGGGGRYQSRDYAGQHQSPPPNEGSPVGASEQGGTGQPDYTAYYAAVASGQDPYAAYGGYEAYVQYYQQYYQYYQQMQQQQQPQQQQGANVPGQPGPEGANPQQTQPPPPASQDSNGNPAGPYSAVPPPPGL
ncbi:hypothetical protein V1525DRAFT_346013 [Lipomyces kononenkoae]|uniref:Uncharacterized protein n=1 Tax=Lipomyces kononenkoae TaxID=34357 RepID=A0ACC3SYM5_LIPKO